MRGHVRKRGKTWAAVLYLGYDELGKKRYKWFGGHATKKEAEKTLTQKLQEINTGSYFEASDDSFGSYMTRWMEDKRTTIRPNTYRSYAWLVNLHIVPSLGHIPLSKLTPAHLQTFYSKLGKKDKPLSNRSIQFAHTLIHEALNRALKWGLVGRNVAEAVDPPRVEKNKGTSWTPGQTVAFMEEAIQNKYGIAFELAIYTGMRKGEILALHWEDIDLDGMTLRVRYSLTFVKGEALFQQPKTERGRRSIALPESLVLSLRRHKALQARERLQMGSAYNNHDLVVCRATGAPLNPRNLDDSWYSLLKKTQLPKIRFHDLRHTHASLLLQQGVHPKIVSERLGHSNINITLDTYSHVLPGLQQQAATLFGESLEEARKSSKKQSK